MKLKKIKNGIRKLYNEKSIELRDEIIAKKSKWIEEVKKIIEGNSRKMG